MSALDHSNLKMFNCFFNIITVLKQFSWGWCTGTTQRDGIGREEGGGFRMGSTCKPVADSF